VLSKKTAEKHGLMFTIYLII